MTGFTITEPQEGEVILTLNWSDAEILTRALGLVNSGNLSTLSPALSNFVAEMVEGVGRSTSMEANRYMPEIKGGQVYIIDIDKVE